MNLKWSEVSKKYTKFIEFCLMIDWSRGLVHVPTDNHGAKLSENCPKKVH